MKKLNPLHHISIIETTGTNCVWVRISHKYEKFQQSFTFKKHGGKDKAIAAAIKVRDIEGKKIYGENWPYTKFAPRKASPLNSSGTIGVSYSESDHAWVATWQESVGGVRKQRNAYFAINKYGERKAQSLAVASRLEAIQANRVT